MAVETGNSNEKNKTGKIEIQEAKTDSYLSNERTFLNWIRTSLASFVLGFVISRFGFWFDQLSKSSQNVQAQSPDNMMAMIIGIGIIALGAVIAVLAVFRYHAVNRIIAKGGGPINTRLPTYVSLAAIAIAIILTVYLILVFQTVK